MKLAVDRLVSALDGKNAALAVSQCEEFAQTLGDQPPASPSRALATRFLLAEGALAHARLDLAVEFLAGVMQPITVLFATPDHPFVAVINCIAARVHLFAGSVSIAERFANSVVGAFPNANTHPLCLATCALVDAAAGRRAEARGKSRELLRMDPSSTNALLSGGFLLMCFAATVMGDQQLAARLALKSSPSPDLSGLRLIDRGISFEVLVHAAIDQGDLDAARSWVEGSRTIASSITDSTLARIECRLLLAAGDPAATRDSARRAWELAHERGRALELAEAEILLARAEIQMRNASHAAGRLSHFVGETSAEGFLAVRASAARELRAVGRRLPPSGGWSGLSVREQEVASLIAAGFTNAQSASALYVSEHTVRLHVSRVLHAYGVAVRSAVASALGGATLREDNGDLPILTTRQHAVASLLASCLSNREIGEQLGISVSTVEKHVSAVKERWDVSSRSGIAGLVSAHLTNDGQPRAPAAPLTTRPQGAD